MIIIQTSKGNNKINMIILGIDPGLAITGYGVIKSTKNKLELIDFGCIRTSSKLTFPKRLKKIYICVDRLIKKYKPNKIALEELFFAKNVKTAMKVGEAKGVAVLTAMLNGIKIEEYTPLQVKQALTGYGKASKIQIQKMVRNILKMKKIPRPDDAADALAIAITCSQSKNFR